MYPALDLAEQEAAMKFIDCKALTDIAARTAISSTIQPRRSRSSESLPEEIKTDPVQYPPDEILEKSEVFADLGESIAYYEDLWVRITSG